MSEWIPIEQYNHKKYAKQAAGHWVVFYHPPVTSGRMYLGPYVTDSQCQARPCTHFLVLPERPDLPPKATP